MEVLLGLGEDVVVVALVGSGGGSGRARAGNHCLQSSEREKINSSMISKSPVSNFLNVSNP